MSEPTRLPTTVAGGCALVAAIVATGTAIFGSTTGLGLGVLGTSILWVGVVRGTGIAFDLGPLVLFGAVLQTGVGGGSVVLTLIGTVAVVLAWDLGHTSYAIGFQLGREANTVRLEVVRCIESLSVGLVSAAIGYALFVFVQIGNSNVALAAFVFAVCFATIALGSGKRTVRPIEEDARP